MNLREKLGKTGISWKFWLFGQELCKSQFFRNWKICTISELQMKKQISKSECTRKTKWNRPFLKILTFWSKSKFYLVKAFFFFFASGSDRVRFPGRSGSNRVSLIKPGSGGWRYAQRARVSTWRVERVKAREFSASAREKTLMIAEPSGGTWRRVAVHLDLKFSCLIDLRPLKTPVGSVLWNFEQVCTNLKDYAAVYRKILAARGSAYGHF